MARTGSTWTGSRSTWARRRCGGLRRSWCGQPRDTWFSPWTALPLGALVTGLDLPYAFPYAIAVERLVAADVPLDSALAVVLGYGLVYCLPGLVLLLVGLRWGGVVRRRLAPLYARFGSASTVPRSAPVAAALALAATAVAVIAATA